MKKFEIIYTLNCGQPVHMEFPDAWELATYCGSLIVKHLGGQKVRVEHFRGPMELAKHVFNELCEVVD